MSPVQTLERLLAFELGDALYALPITAVAEVAEVGAVAAVPTLAAEIGGVVNHHGDALPVVFGDALLEAGGESQTPEHLLVLGEDSDDPDLYGLPVDRIWGLLDGPAVAAVGADVVAERRPIEGRMVNVLDPVRLLEHAGQVVERSMNGSEPTYTGSKS